jgi:hypothetical protein
MDAKPAAELKPEFVVLDSTVFIADYWLRSSSFVLLREFLKKSSAKLVVPRIVLEEVINHHREDLEEIKTEMRNTNRKAGRLLRFFRGPITEMVAVIKKIKDDPYDKFLDGELKAIGASVIDYKDIPHEDVVARDLRRSRPFQKSGKGYRDTLLWETVIRNCIKKGTVTVLVTQNVIDFCDPKGQLHEHLMGDIKKTGAGENDLRLFKDLVQFTDSLVVQYLKARKDFASLVANHKVEGLDLEQVCDENMDTIIAAINTSPSAMSADPGSYEPEVDVVDIPRDFEVIGASEVSKDKLLVTFKSRASVAFTWFLPRSEYATMTDEETSGIYVLDGDWNEHVMQVESSCQIDLQCRLTFDTAEHEVESFEVEDVESVQTD